MKKAASILIETEVKNVIKLHTALKKVPSVLDVLGKHSKRYEELTK